MTADLPNPALMLHRRNNHRKSESLPLSWAFSLLGRGVRSTPGPTTRPRPASLWNRLGGFRCWTLWLGRLLKAWVPRPRSKCAAHVARSAHRLSQWRNGSRPERSRRIILEGVGGLLYPPSRAINLKL